MLWRLVLLFPVLVALAGAETGGRYLVICPDTMLASVTPLTDWKHVTGMMPKVVPLSLVGNDSGSIRNFIRDAYFNWTIPPEYVLLIGDGATLAAGIYREGEYYGSDNLYGDVTGDMRAEIPVGRLPAASAAELDVMVAKTMVYERSPYLTDSLWMRRLTTIVREDGDENDSIYWNNIRFAAQLASAAGFVNCDSLSYQRGHNRDDVIASVDRGTGIVLYRGQGCGNWWSPFDARPESTRNDSMLPIICSFTCGTMSLIPGEREIGDVWMCTCTDSSLRGAVAFYGNTHCQGSVAKYRGAITRGFFTGLFAEGRHRLGRAFLRSKEQLWQEFPEDSSDYRAFTLYGDPDMLVWTATPQALVVDHPLSILPDSQQLVVTVYRLGVPVESALVCASLDTLVYEYGYTDTAGHVELPIEAPETGSVRLVVTGPNFLPYDTLIPIAATGLAQNPETWYVARQVRAVPAVSRTSVKLSWPAGLNATRLSIVDRSGRIIWDASTQDRSHVVWDGRAAQGTRARPGVYWCVLTEPSGHPAVTAKFVLLD